MVAEGGSQVATLESRAANSLPARDTPERSVRLMQEQGMLRKYLIASNVINQAFNKFR